MNVRDRSGIVHLPMCYPTRWDQGADRNRFGVTWCDQWYRWSGQSVGIRTEFHGSPTSAGVTCLSCLHESNFGMGSEMPLSYNSAVNDDSKV